MADTKKRWCFEDTMEPLFWTTDVDEANNVYWAFILDQTQFVVISDADMDTLIKQGKVIEETEESIEAAFADAFKEMKGMDANVSFFALAPSEGSDKKSTEDEGEVIKVPKQYIAELTNTTILPDTLVKKLQIAETKEDKPDCISLLFEGVPGTGKTMAAAYIAKQLGKTMKSYRLSDIMDKYVGESERKLSEAFDKAAEKGHILHIDEIDSISRSRGDETKGHEIKLVNCFLQNLDKFKGTCIFTTNYKDTIDTAIKRRMLLKQEFKNCTKEQANKLARVYFGRKAPRNLPDNVLAPADFDIVKKSFLFEEDEVITTKFIKKRLLEEATERNGEDLANKKTIGFV